MIFRRAITDILMLLFLMFMFSACSSHLEIQQDMPEEAFACMQDYSPDGEPLTRANGENSPPSSFLTINDGKSALEWRLALVESAQQHLDIQYFLWKTDETGTLLVQRVLAAADRGVDVRILLDDLDSTNWNHLASVLTLHPNIEIRVFNPFLKKRGGWATRGFEFVTSLERLNHRMHNKLMSADDKVAIIGGRNLGNEYFGAGKSLDYRDYDVITNGPVVEELKNSFKVFWDSNWSHRISDLPDGDANSDELIVLRKEMDRTIQAADWLSREFNVAPPDWSLGMAAAKAEKVTAPARAVFDCPPSQAAQFPIQTVVTMEHIVDQTRNEILLISPYMVPLEGFHTKVQAVIDRGVTVRLLTNSLAAADHTVAFSGYKKHRGRLLENGVNIHELRPDGEMWTDLRSAASTAKHISLHAKVTIFDRRWIYVGSLNLDPRSVHWNTELGVLIDSRELATRIYDDFQRDMRPENSWRLEQRPKKIGDQADHSQSVLYWCSDDQETTTEPSQGMMQRMSLWFFSLFSLDEQL